MRDLIVFGAVILSLPLCFRRPFLGLLVFSWLAYMRPQDLCWGFARTMRLSFFVGLTMVVGFFATESGRRPFWRPDVRTVSMLLLVLLTWISTLPAKVFDKWVVNGLIEFTKIVIVAMFTTGQVDSRKRLRMLLWTIALCLGFFGFKGGLFGVLTGGATILRGPGGMLLDNNDFALALVMAIPMLFYLGQSEDNRLVRRFAWVTAGLTAFTVLLTHSRGGFIALCVAALIMAWRSGKLLQATAGLATAAIMFLAFVPSHVLERLASIGDVAAGQQDSSVDARLRAWSIAFNMIEGNPVLGVGHKNFQHRYYDYSADLIQPGERVFNHVAHNSYLQIWAEGGTPAFLIWLVMVGSVFVATRSIRRSARGVPGREWAKTYANLAEATTVAFLVGAVFLNRGHFDLLYHWVAIVSALVFVSRVEFAREPLAEPASPARRTRGVSVHWRPIGVATHLPRWGRVPR